jgi:hypothetical protein
MESIATRITKIMTGMPIHSTFAVLRFRDQRWVGSCLTSRAGLTLTVAQRAMP